MPTNYATVYGDDEEYKAKREAKRKAEFEKSMQDWKYIERLTLAAFMLMGLATVLLVYYMLFGPIS